MFCNQTFKTMERPFKYLVVCDATKKQLSATNIEPVEGEYKGATVYEDKRYPAKLRLYNRVTHGASLPKYEPYKGTAIGKHVGLLDFTQDANFWLNY